MKIHAEIVFPGNPLCCRSNSIARFHILGDIARRNSYWGVLCHHEAVPPLSRDN